MGLRKFLRMKDFRNSPSLRLKDVTGREDERDLIIGYRPEVAVLVTLDTANELEMSAVVTKTSEFTSGQVSKGESFTKFIRSLGKSDIVYITSYGKRIGALVSPDLVRR